MQFWISIKFAARVGCVFKDILKKPNEVSKSGSYKSGHDNFNYDDRFDNVSNNSDDNDMDSLDQEIREFMGLLYNKFSFQKSFVQELFENFAKTLKKKIPPEFHDCIDESLQIDILDDLSTEYKRFKYLTNN